MLAWLIVGRRGPARGGRDALASASGAAGADAETGRRENGATDAQRLVRERGIEPDPELVVQGDPGA